MNPLEDPLELETRRRIYQHLQKFPGAHMREIGREVDIPMGTLEYHLHYLVKANLLTTRQDARYTRYFPTGELSRREKDVLAILRQKVPRQIAAHLMLHPGASHGHILTQFALSASTLSFHLKKLVTGGIVSQEKSGRENLYRVLEPELVAKVLIQHRASFFDDVVDRFADVWLNLDPALATAAAPQDEGSGGAAGGDPAPPSGGLGPGGGVLVVLRFMFGRVGAPA